jgi:hypothetical protein
MVRMNKVLAVFESFAGQRSDARLVASPQRSSSAGASSFAFAISGSPMAPGVAAISFLAAPVLGGTMQRLTYAYLLIALILVIVSGLAAYKTYFSRTRSYDRRVRKERTDHEKAMAKRAAEAGDRP